MDVYNLKKKEILELSSNLPTSSNYTPLEFDSLLLIPTKKKHDSGYNCILVVGVNNGEAVCKITDWSDALKFNVVDDYKLSRHVRIDCLPNGILRLWGKQIKSDGFCVSTIDFDVTNE